MQMWVRNIIIKKTDAKICCISDIKHLNSGGDNVPLYLKKTLYHTLNGMYNIYRRVTVRGNDLKGCLMRNDCIKWRWLAWRK